MRKLTLLSAIILSLGCTGTASAGEQGKIYGRVDLGYGLSKYHHKIIRYVTPNKFSKGLITEAGIGYNISDQVRADFTLGFSPNFSNTFEPPYPEYFDGGGPDKPKEPINDNTMKVKKKSATAMFNVYYDFNNSTRFTPYLMLGTGFERTKYKENSVKTKEEWHSRYVNKFAYQVGVGLATEVYEDVLFDLGYKLTSSQNRKFKAIDHICIDNLSPEYKPEHKDLLVHKFTAGLRVSF